MLDLSPLTYCCFVISYRGWVRVGHSELAYMFVLQRYSRPVYILFLRIHDEYIAMDKLW